MISIILNRTDVIIWDLPYLAMQFRDLIDDGGQKGNSGRFTEPQLTRQVAAK